MKYFTRAWATGGLTDADYESVLPSYRRHFDRIEGSLPAGLITLARELSIHDGLIRRVVVDRQADTLALELLCGDLQIGYFDLDLVYGQVDWGVVDIIALARRAEDRDTEILYDEVDCQSKGVYEHRILFEPDDEIEIRFSRFELRKHPRKDRNLAPLKNRYIDRHEA